MATEADHLNDHDRPDDVALQAALDVLGDPVRRSILRQLAARPEWAISCGMFDLPVSKATASHHFAVLRESGLLEQGDEGTRRLNRLNRTQFDQRFPGLLDLVLQQRRSGSPGPGPPVGDHP